MALNKKLKIKPNKSSNPTQTACIKPPLLNPYDLLLTGFALLFILLSLSFTPKVFAVDHQMTEAVNRAGMQRMLSQRIAKAYFLMGLGENHELAQHQLTNAVARYNDNLEFLTRLESKHRLITSLPDLVDMWHSFQSLVTQPVSQINGKLVLNSSEALLLKAEELTYQYETISGTQGAEIVNISGRQRMLSQRISKLYMAYCWQLKGEEALDEMLESLSEYEVALSFLRGASLNTKSISHNLRKVAGQLKFAQKSFDKLNEGSYLIHVVNSTTDTMLKQMDQVTHQYVDVINERPALSQL